MDPISGILLLAFCVGAALLMSGCNSEKSEESEKSKDPFPLPTIQPITEHKKEDSNEQLENTGSDSPPNSLLQLECTRCPGVFRGLKGVDPNGNLIQGEIGLFADHTDFVSFTICDYFTPPHECEPVIEENRWFGVDPSQSSEGKPGLTKDNSYMICTLGKGIIYPVDSGQVEGDLERLIKDLETVGDGQIGDEEDGITIGNGVFIPRVITGEINGKQFTVYPLDAWGGIGVGRYPEGIQKDDEGRYKIAVGPKIINPEYPDDGKLWEDDITETNKIVEIILRNKQTGNIKIIECVVTDLKAHSYNKYPDGHEKDTGDIGSMDVDNGIVQTGMTYPNSANAGWDKSCDPTLMNGTIIEFCGHDVDFEPSEYALEDIITVE